MSRIKHYISIALKLTAAVSLCGCANEVVIDYRNYSDDTVIVHVEGLAPKVHSGPMVLPPNRRGPLGGASIHLDTSLGIAENIVVSWNNKAGGKNNTVHFDRADLKLPAKIRKGVLSISYEKGVWRIVHINKSYDEVLHSL